MKFNLELTDDLNNERIFLNLISRQPHSFGQIRGLVDTGSPTTIISLKDSIRLNLPLNNSNKGDPICGFGKGGVPSKRIKKFSFALKSEDNKIKYLEMPVLVADLTEIKKLDLGRQENILRIPTIIGMDFLRETELKLIVNMKSKESFLESN